MDLPNGQEMTILEDLSGGRERYGLELVKRNPKKLGRTSIYVVLTRMVARGLLETRLETDEEQTSRGPKRRLYKITGYGLAAYQARLAAEVAAARAFKGVAKPKGAM